MSDVVREQAAPEANGLPAVWELVLADMAARDADGRQKYGVPLQPFNGRDPLVDAYQESLDQSVYLRSAIFERAALLARVAELEAEVARLKGNA
ncbi:MAG: hypothetical protein RL199_2241 [Pseudomonadota bacterium]|jgi:hypothetical protein